VYVVCDVAREVSEATIRGGASRVVRDASVQLASSTRCGRFGELALRRNNVSASWEEVEDEGEGLPGEFFGFLKQLPIEGDFSSVRAYDPCC